MELNPLTALSPIDGRYARQTDVLRDIFSECAFMNARVRVEVEWLISLSEAGFAELPHLSDHGKAFLRGLADNFSIADCEAIKEIENTYKFLVYAVTHKYLEFGEFYDFLYVPEYKSEWKYTLISQKEIFYSYAYVWNKTDDNCSEFGTIGIRSFGGGIKRVM